MKSRVFIASAVAAVLASASGVASVHAAPIHARVSAVSHNSGGFGTNNGYGNGNTNGFGNGQGGFGNGRGGFGNGCGGFGNHHRNCYVCNRNPRPRKCNGPGNAYTTGNFSSQQAQAVIASLNQRASRCTAKSAFCRNLREQAQQATVGARVTSDQHQFVAPTIPSARTGGAVSVVPVAGSAPIVMSVSAAPSGRMVAAQRPVMLPATGGAALVGNEDSSGPWPAGIVTLALLLAGVTVRRAFHLTR